MGFQVAITTRSHAVGGNCIPDLALSERRESKGLPPHLSHDVQCHSASGVRQSSSGIRQSSTVIRHSTRVKHQRTLFRLLQCVLVLRSRHELSATVHAEHISSVFVIPPFSRKGCQCTLNSSGSIAMRVPDRMASSIFVVATRARKPASGGQASGAFPRIASAKFWMWL